jgi:hypothetical protein
MQDGIDGTIDCNCLTYVLMDEAKAGMALERSKISAVSGQQVVKPDDLMALGDQPVTHMGSNEPGGAGNDDSQFCFFPPTYSIELLPSHRAT